jgi:hypothetical protein
MLSPSANLFCKLVLLICTENCAANLCCKIVLRICADNVIIPFDLTQLFCPSFTLAAGPPSGFTTDGVGCWGGALWRACNLTSFSPYLTGPVDHPFASRHKGPGFKTPRGALCETGILPLALSCYNTNFLFVLFRNDRPSAAANSAKTTFEEFAPSHVDQSENFIKKAGC